MTTVISWRWVWMTGLVAAAIASYGILNRGQEAPFVSQERPVQPGYYLKDAILTTSRPDGKPRLRLVAEQIRENVARNSYVARTVRVNYLEIPGQPWALRSDQADAPAGLETVEFSGHVELRSDKSGRTGIIRTESLNLDTRTNVAHTSAPVEIEFGGQRLNATGLKADLRSGRLQLESTVHGQFQKQ